MTLDEKGLGLDRRVFLRGTAGAGSAIALQALMARSATAQPGGGFDPLGSRPKPAPNNGGYGPLKLAPGGQLWLPAGGLADGGQLQMLAVRGRPEYDTRTGQRLERAGPRAGRCSPG